MLNNFKNILTNMYKSYNNLSITSSNKQKQGIINVIKRFIT